MKSSNPRQHRGFTLTELVLVLAVIGILSAVGTARFSSKADLDERFFFDDTLAALRYAQKLAVATGCEVGVSFSASGYTVAQRATCTAGVLSTPVAHPGTGGAGYNGQAPGGVTLSSTVQPLFFDALGRARDSGGSVTDATISVGARQIRAEGETGFVHAL